MTQRQPVAAFFPRKNRADLDYRQGLVSAVSERDGAGFAERWCARDRGSPAARCRCGRRICRRAVDHGGEPAQAGLRDFPQHQVVGGGPGVAPGLAARLLAGQPQRPLLIGVIDVPDPGDHGLAAHDLRREIAATLTMRSNT